MKIKFNNDADDLHARKSSKLAGYGSAFFKDYLLSESGERRAIETFQSLFAENYTFSPEDRKKYLTMPCMKILQLFYSRLHGRAFISIMGSGNDT